MLPDVDNTYKIKNTSIDNIVLVSIAWPDHFKGRKAVWPCNTRHCSYAWCMRCVYTVLLPTNDTIVTMQAVQNNPVWIEKPSC